MIELYRITLAFWTVTLFIFRNWRIVEGKYYRESAEKSLLYIWDTSVEGGPYYFILCMEYGACSSATNNFWCRLLFPELRLKRVRLSSSSREMFKSQQRKVWEGWVLPLIHRDAGVESIFFLTLTLFNLKWKWCTGGKIIFQALSNDTDNPLLHDGIIAQADALAYEDLRQIIEPTPTQCCRNGWLCRKRGKISSRIALNRFRNIFMSVMWNWPALSSHAYFQLNKSVFIVLASWSTKYLSSVWRGRKGGRADGVVRRGESNCQRLIKSCRSQRKRCERGQHNPLRTNNLLSDHSDVKTSLYPFLRISLGFLRSCLLNSWQTFTR